MSVNNKLKTYLKEHGIKQSFLVEKTGLSKLIISNVVNGKRKLTAEELAKIAKALNVDYNIFLK